MSEVPLRPKRIDLLDVARGIALLAMASYHFTWDLEFFGYVEPGTTAQGLWKLYARAIASTFLILAGVSLVLAHGNGIRWRGFAKRFAMVAGAALAISAATYVAVPSGFIFFGILHQIAVASLFGLAFLRLPALLILAIAVLVIAAPAYLRAAVFDQPALWWLGLAPVNPRSNDYVPVFPWFGAFLIGMALARLAISSSLRDRLAVVRPSRWTWPFRLGGRNSLAFYLIHQPILIGCVWLFAQMWPAPVATPEANFTRICKNNCAQEQNVAYCQTYCGCFLEKVQSEKLLDQVFERASGDEVDLRLGDIGFLCSTEVNEMEVPAR
jgi:uncharacterized membrane protein